MSQIFLQLADLLEHGRLLDLLLQPNDLLLLGLLHARHLLLLLEKATGEPITGAEVLSSSGQPLKAWEVQVLAGPGADDYVRELVGEDAAVYEY